MTIRKPKGGVSINTTGPLDMGPLQTRTRDRPGVCWTERWEPRMEVAQGADRRPEGAVHTHAHRQELGGGRGEEQRLASTC